MSPEDEFKVLKDFISDIQKNILSLLPRTNNSSDDGIVTTSCATNDVAYAAATNIRGVEWMCADLVYILNTIDMSISSQNSIDREYLLCKLMDVPNHHSPAEFPLGSHNLNQLLQIIFNLKLLAPDREGERVGRYTGYMFHFTRSKNKENDAMVNGTQGTINLLTSYECLTQIEKDCLSCFSVFPRDSLVVKRRVLIHWWVGEGFIDLNPNSNPGTSMKSCSTTNDVNQVSLQVNASASRPSVMDIGNQMLKVLEEKGFIEPVMKKGRESGFCHMQPSVHSFVTAQAREGGFFDFDQNGQLKSCFSRSKRACLLTSLDNIPSSYSLWAKYTHFPKRLKSFKTVRTLFNVNEAVIDINKEWFSRMKYLSVLHLGGWHPEKPVVIDVVDPSFLKELKNMKQLRLLNLQGLSPITKLPDSICKLIDLRILDLRGCSYLEELPADIGSLKNLIHLDTTDCRFLSKLPKGIRLLSKLEVLKGFIITHEDSSRQNRKLFILEDLLNLRKLSKLILIVKVDGFPDSQDLLVFKGIKNLCKLNITWEIMTFTKQERRPMIDQEAPKGCVCLKRSCKAHRLHQNHKEETSTIHNQSNLRKLVLYNFPHETAPSLLDPSKWKKLEELHISGGRLRELPGGTDDMDKWNVKTLRLKYLRSLEITWPDLRSMFPQMTYLENVHCDRIHDSPCDAEGVWRK